MGIDFNHKPIMVEEVIKYLNIKPEGTYVDGTLGGAGHSREICGRLSERGILVGIDQDEEAIKVSAERLKDIKPKILLANDNFKNIKKIVNGFDIEKVDGILLDLGVSSYQFDEGERGFSYQKDAILDMRMDRRSSLTAEEIVNGYPRKDIENIIRKYGEEKWASRIAEFIDRRRQVSRIKTTGELVDIIKAAIPAAARREGPHPAKRTFQALRIAVNDELEILEKALDDCIDILKEGGRLCVITFHSLEDTIVKNVYMNHAHPCSCPADFPVCVCGKKPSVMMVNKKPIQPGMMELEVNPRARSSKLRVAEKIP